MKKTLTTCPYCGTGCALYLLADDAGRLIGVEPSGTHPTSRGGLCVKGWNAHAFVHHPERLTTPLLRRGGRLEPASWDEALELVAEKLRGIALEHGPDALMFFSSAKATNEENYLLMKLARAVFATNNVDHCARLCHASTVVGLAETFGSGAMTNSIACVDEADCILVTGSNTTEQHPLIGSRILQAKQRGARLIVADSRRIRLARLADLHLRQRNGSDVALVNGLMHVILREGLEDKAFIEARTENFAALQQEVAAWTPQRAAAVTGLAPEQIVEAARMFAAAKRAMVVYSMGITQHSHGVDNVRAIANLALLTGNLGRPGTGVNPLRGQNNVQGACDMGALPNVLTGYQKVADPAVRVKFAAAWGVERLPEAPGLMATRAMNLAAEGRMKGFFILGENPMLSDPDQQHVRRALESLDFLVVQDIFLSATAELADVVLPAACYAEKDGSFTSTERRVQRVRKGVEPPGAARADWEILGELAARLGYGGMTYGQPAEIMEEIAALTPSYAGIDYPRIETLGLCWPCPDKRHPGTPILHRESFARGKGLFSPTGYQPPAELPDAEFPLLLTTGRTYFHWHTGTMTRRTHLLDREERCAFVELNPEDARELGVRHGEPVLVASRRGEVTARTRVTEMVPPGTIFMPFHFEEGAVNALTHNVLDPEAGIPEYKVCGARVRKKA
ncbi:formate dehydrogenase subunit alpha [Desulfuromonas versatilis]|uniref:Formate dehydrogenase subunit alpha n=1 Tax=Desulfuromonas versatilis TaxID=2802975 RepID=A0ABM8HS90_9BACT|nr:formate dehydrogenase subunit alpha [Desulfuromonas versatilis]BCR03465.1 formate dehydrogenase subunit alpha [Desulfuromonas versatilis]